MDDLIREWKAKVSSGICINQNTVVNIMIFAGNQVVIQTSEEELQTLVHLLRQLCNTYNLKMPLKKTKTIAFWGSHRARTKVINEGHILEQVSHFWCLGCEISYACEKDVESKLL
jgi:hypothetical protein